jgi:16S rRNA (cytosine967-C5)-methyltransferase
MFGPIFPKSFDPDFADGARRQGAPPPKAGLMIAAARLSAAIEILADIETRHRPAADALKDWGLSHRFAGSKDRAAIGSLVFDALRCRASAAWIMGAPTPRGVLLGSLRQMRNLSAEAIAALCNGERFAPSPLSEDEAQRLATGTLDDAPINVRGDFPDWLEAAFSDISDDPVAEGRALAARAPLDLRVNILKVKREKVLATLARLDAAPTPLSPFGVRIPLLPEGRNPPIATEPAYLKGHVEIQDEGSQIAALLCGARAGEQVLDLCAGAGGKSLALAAEMDNHGQIYATDLDPRRLAAIYARLERAATRNVQVRTPKRGTDGEIDVLADLVERCDLVLVDAPCTGTGTWRRNPDAKWRMRPGSLEQRIKEQDEIIDKASQYVKAGGRIIYATCSLLKAENEERLNRFLAEHSAFAPMPIDELTRGLPELARFASGAGVGLRLSPHRSGTDGFFIAGLRRH